MKDIKQVYDNDNILIKKEDNVRKWNHQDIMENTEEFKEYLFELTNLDNFINKIDTNEFLAIIKNNSKTVNSFLERIKMVVKEINREEYDKWTKYKINRFVNLFSTLIKEKNELVNKKEIQKFKGKMRNIRNTENFILENIYRINVLTRKISVVRLNNKVSKKEYVDNLNIVMICLWVISYLFALYDIFISKTFKFEDKQTINSIILNQYEYKDLFQSENMYKCLNTLLYYIFLIMDVEEYNE